MSTTWAGDAQPLTVLGIDVGTSSIRALLYDSDGNAVSGVESQIAYVPETAPDGRVTVDPKELFNLLAAVIDEVVARAKVAGIAPTAVAMSCFWHSFIALDQSAQPLTPVLLWADTRAGAVIPELSKQVDVRRLHRRTGCRLHASYWPAKIVWLGSTDPSVFRRSARYVSFAEYVCIRLFGSASVSVSMASGTGLLNTATCEWDEYALSILPSGVDYRLSPIDDSPRSGITTEFAGRWPSLASIPWYPAYGDGACSNIGATGLGMSSAFVLTVGTSAAIRSVTVEPASKRPAGVSISPALWHYRVDRDHGIVGGALSEGGNLIAWLEATTRLPPLAEAEVAIAKRAPDAGALTVLPFIAGERSPDWTTGSRATFAGITLATQPLDLLQAAMESISYELRSIFESMVDALGDPENVFAAGAALARSPVWLQIIANVVGSPLRLAPQIESSSRGAALLVLDRLGVGPGQSVEADTQPLVRPFRTEGYAGAMARQQILRKRMSE